MKENCDFSRQSHSFFKRHEQQINNHNNYYYSASALILKTTDYSDISEGCRTLKEKENNKYNGCRTLVHVGEPLARRSQLDGLY